MAKKLNNTNFQTSQRLKYKPLFNANKTTTTTNIPVTPATAQKRPRLAPLLLGGAFLYVTATYVSMIVFKSKQDTAPVEDDTVDQQVDSNSTSVQPRKKKQDDSEPVTPTNFDTSSIWGQVANRYDKEIGWDERVMGIGLLRRFLVGQAKGDVLEVSTGTGRNFDYYKADQMDSLTVTDDHLSMLEQAQSKFKQYEPSFHNTFVAFKQANVDRPETLEKKKYDTVVDTFGLCSCADPAGALVSMADACKSEESRILLLEHGRSHYDWLNRLLDNQVDQHVKKWGCWWNRNIMDLFEEKRVKEKVEIVSVYRWHFGTTCYVVAKPKKA